MILDSSNMMMVMDFLVFGLVLLTIIVAASFGLIDFSKKSSHGQRLVLLGAIVPALFYLVDIVLIRVIAPANGLPDLIPVANFLHRGVGWVTPVLSAGLVFFGLMILIRERSQALESLQLTEARLNEAQRIASIGNWERNLVTNDLWWSDEVYRMFQLNSDSFEASYDAFLERVHPEDRRIVTQAVERAVNGQDHYSIDHRIVLPDSTHRIVHEQGEVTFDIDRQAIRMMGTMHDITARKAAEDEVRQRAEYQALLARLSSELVRAKPADLGQQLSISLEIVAENYGLDAISMWWFTEDRKRMKSFHRWERDRSESRPAIRGRSEFPWISQHLLSGEVVVVHDIEEMPAEAAADKKMFEERGAKSFLIIPLLVDNNLEGSCVFSAQCHRRRWSDDVIADLKLIGDNLAGAYARSLSVAKVEELKEQLQDENIYLREEIRLAHGFDEIVGEDPGLRICLQAVEKVAPTDIPVLVGGETGTGKELIARSVHNLSARSDKPMVSVNCPALPSDLIDSELFGHEKGAFTGAQAQRRGRFELAGEGTLFLDEIGELPLNLQAKLLRVLQTGDFQRLGGTKTLHSKARLIVATNRDLKQSVEKGEFRADLYYRISVFPIHLPALRERRNDIALLAEHFVRKHADRLGKDINAISAQMIEKLRDYDWPGNIRELESVIERALISSTGGPTLELPSSLRLTGRDAA